MEECLDEIRSAMEEIGDGANFVCFVIANESKDRGTIVLRGSYKFAKAAVAHFVSEILDSTPEDMRELIAKDLCNAINEAIDESKKGKVN